MLPLTITPVVQVVCHATIRVETYRSPGCLYTSTRCNTTIDRVADVSVLKALCTKNIPALQIHFREVFEKGLWNNWQPYTCLYRETSHCGIDEISPRDPSILSPRRLPGRFRLGFLHVGTIPRSLLSTCFGDFKRSTWRTKQHCQPSCGFHANDRTSVKLALLCEMPYHTSTWHFSHA
ncbi:hypothetical protein TNCV_1876471 [Trichonephila clavipes]|nr:hypothetical protein TNCV_1876471 [Trichonephila clavipes]